MSEFADAAMFGRDDEITAVEDALRNTSSAGIVIEGEMGTGKTALAREIHRRRGAAEIWVRGDRVLRSVPYGAFGLYLDLNAEPADLLNRLVVLVRSSDESPPAVFVDDGHDLDSSSLGTIWQLANDGDINLVITQRPPVDDRPRLFGDLIADGVLDHVVLGPLDRPDFDRMVEHYLGGIVSRGVLDVADFQSGRVPGTLVELLRYANRTGRLLDRRGAWVLDGLDIDFDQRARDVTRVQLASLPQQQREALELVDLAGEVDVAAMLAAGRGEAADALASSGNIRLVRNRMSRAYATVENHRAETVRMNVPLGRSREMYEFIDGFDDSPSDWARMLRAEWGLSCGARISSDALVRAGRTAIRLGEWQRAQRILQTVPVDDLRAHELLDLGWLYCEINEMPIGLDVLAQAVEKACCTDVVLDVFSAWVFCGFHRDTPLLRVDDFRVALSRLAASGPLHDSAGADVGQASELIEVLYTNQWAELSDDVETIRAWAADVQAPEILRLCLGIASAVRAIERGRNAEALETLDDLHSSRHRFGILFLLHSVLRARVLVELGRDDEAGAVLDVHISNDLAYFASKSGPTDLGWTRLHLEHGRMDLAMRSSSAAVEALDYWNQTPFLAIALAEAQHVSALAGDTAAADAFDVRYRRLPPSKSYVEGRRAEVLRTVARAKVTGNDHHLTTLRELLASAENDGAHQLAATIRIELFRHSGEYDVEAMLRLSEVGTGRECRLVGQLGSALRARDKEALETVAGSVDTRMPDMAERCRIIVNGGDAGRSAASAAGIQAGHAVGGVSLTSRERQISRLIVAGMTNAEIADELGVAVRTVEGHTYRMYRKLDISSRDQVADALGHMQIGF